MGICGNAWAVGWNKFCGIFNKTLDKYEKV